jgi:small-conductance mechanosensitive channel
MTPPALDIAVLAGGTQVALLSTVRWTLRGATLIAGTVISLTCPSGLEAQDATRQRTGRSTLAGVSLEALEEIVAKATPDTPAALTVANREIVVFRATLLGRTSSQRVSAAMRLLSGIIDSREPITVASRSIAGGSLVSVNGDDVLAIVPADADPLLGETLENKTMTAVERLQQALDETLEATRPRALAWAALAAAAATAAFVAILVSLVRVNRRATVTIARTAATRLATSRVGDELVRHTSLVRYVIRTLTMLTVIAGGTVAYWWVSFVLRLFPYTRPWGESLRSFLVDRVVQLGHGLVSTIPSLFTILVIVVMTRLAIKLVHLVFMGIERGRYSIPGIYPETASSSRKLLTGLLWVFALVVSYPYLPGSDTEAFKGISVFIGLMVSLGSSGLVNQVMSGFTVTYSRALRHGDYVRVGEVEGTVTHIGTLSTKIETPRREEVTIPNAVLVSQTVTNYSRNADTMGVYTPTSITIGYDVPWRQVEALLLLAADRTEGVRREPAPAVLQVGLEDFYVRYTLLVALEQPHRRGPILATLHANIQDAFNEHGVQIMSPNYEADPETRKIVPRDQWFAAPAARRRETDTVQSA